MTEGFVNPNAKAPAEFGIANAAIDIMSGPKTYVGFVNGERATVIAGGIFINDVHIVSRQGHPVTASKATELEDTLPDDAEEETDVSANVVTEDNKDNHSGVHSTDKTKHHHLGVETSVVSNESGMDSQEIKTAIVSRESGEQKVKIDTGEYPTDAAQNDFVGKFTSSLIATVNLRNKHASSDPRVLRRGFRTCEAFHSAKIHIDPYRKGPETHGALYDIDGEKRIVVTCDNKTIRAYASDSKRPDNQVVKDHVATVTFLNPSTEVKIGKTTVKNSCGEEAHEITKESPKQMAL